MLRAARDACGHKIDVKTVLPPRRKYWRYSGCSFAPCYLNAYVANSAVVTGQFGDPDWDDKVRNILAKAFPEKEIQMLTIDHIASGGGGVHCLTQPFPEQLVKGQRHFLSSQQASEGLR